IRSEPLDKFIFISSTAVYNPLGCEFVSSKTDPNPSDLYGQSKLLAEKEIKISGLPYVILRLAPVYAEGMTRNLEVRIIKIFGINILFSPAEKRFTMLSLSLFIDYTEQIVSLEGGEMVVNLGDKLPLSQLDILQKLQRNPCFKIVFNAAFVYSMLVHFSRFLPKNHQNRICTAAWKMLKSNIVKE
ncbi:MAG: sugar nucleotide-binding protein, partial [bacterium]